MVSCRIQVHSRKNHTWEDAWDPEGTEGTKGPKPHNNQPYGYDCLPALRKPVLWNPEISSRAILGREWSGRTSTAPVTLAGNRTSSPEVQHDR